MHQKCFALSFNRKPMNLARVFQFSSNPSWVQVRILQPWSFSCIQYTIHFRFKGWPLWHIPGFVSKEWEVAPPQMVGPYLNSLWTELVPRGDGMGFQFLRYPIWILCPLPNKPGIGTLKSFLDVFSPRTLSGEFVEGDSDQKWHTYSALQTMVFNQKSLGT
jgi:hypothetical protein